MRKPIEQCPACGSFEMVVTEQTCVDCGTAVRGQFRPNIFSRLAPENLAFVEAFVRNRGNVKEMERELGISYWAIRNQLNVVIEALGFGTAEAETAPNEERRAVLARLELGEISAAEAAALLREMGG